MRVSEHCNTASASSRAVAAGGVDAMDWAEMLERMYSRWAAAHGYSLSVSDRSPGEEAGIKGAELTIRGRWAYGYLKGELLQCTCSGQGDGSVVDAASQNQQVLGVCCCRLCMLDAWCWRRPAAAAVAWMAGEQGVNQVQTLKLPPAVHPQPNTLPLSTTTLTARACVCVCCCRREGHAPAGAQLALQREGAAPDQLCWRGGAAAAGCQHAAAAAGHS